MDAVMRRLGRVREHLAAATSAVPEEAELGSEVVKVAGGEVHASSGRIGRLRDELRGRRNRRAIQLARRDQRVVKIEEHSQASALG